MEVTVLLIRLITFAFAVALGIVSLVRFSQGLLFLPHGSEAAQITIYWAVGCLVISAVLFILLRYLESRSPIATPRRF